MNFLQNVKYSIFHYLHFHAFRLLEFVCAVDTGARHNSASVHNCELRMLFPAVVHCIWHLAAGPLQPQMLGDVSENAVLHINIDGDGNFYAGIFETFARGKREVLLRLFVSLARNVYTASLQLYDIEMKGLERNVYDFLVICFVCEAIRDNAMH